MDTRQNGSAEHAEKRGDWIVAPLHRVDHTSRGDGSDGREYTTGGNRSVALITCPSLYGLTMRLWTGSDRDGGEASIDNDVLARDETGGAR
jgi:hypothetical protein